jgi:hypothetical protein
MVNRLGKIRLGVATGIVLGALGQAPPALAHGTVAHLSAAQEKKLERVERRTLGPEHAAEHAESRRLAAKAQAAAEKHGRWLRSLQPAERRSVRSQERDAAKARVSRLRARAAQAGPPSDVGQWTTGPTNIPVMGINAATLPTGKVLLWAYPTNPNPAYNPAYKPGGIGSAPNNSLSAVWDPATGKTKVIPPPINPDTGERTNLWCSGISFLADGRVLATGGNLGYTPDWRGLQRAYIFNPWTETWSEVGKMHGGRWYPSQVLLADGRTLVLQGYDETGTQTMNSNVDVFDPATGQFSLLGRLGSAGAPPRTGSYYPHTFLMPSGRVLIAGQLRVDSWLFNHPGNDLSWTDIPHPAPFQDRQWGTAVLLPGGRAGSTRVMQLGGSWVDSPAGVASVKTTEVFDEANQGAGWHFTSSLNVGRGHANTVLLPDGSMVEVGGGKGTNPEQSNQYVVSGAERQVELWNPTTGQWRLGPPQVEARAYHSTAVLLPDGRVMSAGDDYDGTGGPGTGLSQDTLEIYSPPYLFHGSRPGIAWAPDAVRWNTTFGVASRDGNVTRAVLMAPSATTHATDMNQRMLNVPVTKRADGRGYNVVSPTGPTAAPPGVYMLFLLNDRGVPSVARWIKLDGNAPPPPDIPADIFTSPAARDTTPPKILSARMTRRRMITAPAKRRRGTTFVLRLSERARVSFRFQKARRGQKVRHRCVKPDPSRARRRSCTRYTSWGPYRRTAILKKGTSKVRFAGKLGRRWLPSGRWRARIVARDPAGNRSRTRTLHFKVLRLR